MIYLRSLKRTYRLEKIKAKPSVKSVSIIIKVGNSKIKNEYFILKNGRSINVTIRVARNVIRFIKTTEIGIISLGKYTFLIRLPLSKIHVVDDKTELLKNCHGTIPVMRNIEKA